MRHSFVSLAQALLVAALCLLALPAMAQANLSDKSLDELFASLKQAPDQATATGTSNEIWKRWTEPDDPDLAELMRRVLQARDEYDLATAYDLANQVITADPDYAEGWNQRATVEYLLGEYQASLEDVAETLKREPRHFGALAGKVLIQMKLGDKAGARKTLVEALAINPFLSERGLFPELGPPPTRT